MEKSEIRKKYQDLRSSVQEDELESMSLEIANRSLELDIWEANYYHLYLPIQGKKEVNTEYLLHILQGRDKSVVISRSNFETMEMKHYLLQENTSLKLSKFGIPEPESGIEIATNILDVIFVPLLAFNRLGHRIGYGKGFYDRFLAQCRPESVKVGMSFFEAEEKFIHENMDFPLDYCITPKKIYGFKNSKLYL
jgi:5-formyltetrahydrofolate cyclo-ligase